MPPLLTNIERVKFAKLLGVYIMDNLGAGKQIDYLFKICNQRVYLLNQIKEHGPTKQQLLRVFDAIIISHTLLLLGGDLQSLQHAMQYKPFLKRSRDGVLFLMTEILMTF